MTTMYKIAFTGHRPQKLRYPTLVKEQIHRVLKSEQQAHQHLLVISGGALGVDQYAAEASLKLGIPFILILPFPPAIMCAKWPLHARNHLQELIQAAVKTYITQQEFSFSGYQARNEAMVDHCDKLCAVWDGSSGGTANCVHYAESGEHDIHFIKP